MERVKYVECVQKPPDAVFLKNLHTNINNVIDIEVALRSLPVLKNPPTNINNVIDIDGALRSLPVLKNLYLYIRITFSGVSLHKNGQKWSNNFATLLVTITFSGVSLDKNGPVPRLVHWAGQLELVPGRSFRRLSHHGGRCGCDRHYNHHIIIIIIKKHHHCPKQDDHLHYCKEEQTTPNLIIIVVNIISNYHPSLS